MQLKLSAYSAGTDSILDSFSICDTNVSLRTTLVIVFAGIALVSISAKDHFGAHWHDREAHASCWPCGNASSDQKKLLSNLINLQRKTACKEASMDSSSRRFP